ncbi:AAA family ATPase [Mesorhizobium sp. RMAD-H1]|uniref:AAA family ATPase n=1 Tax=Mesorhizobium sp. RMAD-H1 TaxID=2587065 RepID=UPI00161DA7DE|nr:AAA family ATPase [Mesorhizobium sp. RMAD-H1]MBB2971149.1 adenylate kinase family enzyme [Mesorhizobium sp. RMAD-H1]
MMDRIFIMGNGGSGKTWLAQELARRLQFPAYHLDDFHWLPNFVGERPRDERDQLVARAANGNSWIMEGIYGSIIQQMLPRMTTLIWLDISDEECISNLLQRGQTNGGTEEQFEELLEYTRGYRLRKNHLNSFDAHKRFFEAYPSHKLKLCGRLDVAAFLTSVALQNTK